MYSIEHETSPSLLSCIIQLGIWHAWTHDSSRLNIHWELQFAWHHAISIVSMAMAKGTNGSSDKILMSFISRKETKFLEKLSFTQK